MLEKKIVYILKWPKLDFNGFVNDVIIGPQSHLLFLIGLTLDNLHRKEFLFKVQLLFKIIDNVEI